MTATFRAGLVALLALGLLTPAAVASSKPALAPAEKGQMKVQDDGQVFSPDSITKAEAKFNGVTFKAPTHLTVRTFATVPADRKSDYDKVKSDTDKKRTFMVDWAKELAQGEAEKGVYVLICTETRMIEVISDRQTDLSKHFSDQDAKKVFKALKDGFEAANAATAKSEDEKRAIRGDGLVRATDIVIAQLRNETAPAEKGTTGTTHATGDGAEPKKDGGWPIWLWIVVILGVLLFIWIIVALIRAMTGNVYGGMYAGGGGGYGYGGGGPGFFGCFMGGMFGAMAGMWMYNSMMGTHYAHDPSAATGGYGDTGGGDAGADTGAGDFDGGAEAGGGWDDGGGGGDAGGGGGGDWGDGGGDAGGGGDWGGDGGGGDFGGGGGDFGGGGGDW